MSPKLRLILIVVVVLLTLLIVVGMSYNVAKKAKVGPTGEPAQPTPEESAQPLKVGRYSLGEFVATTRDEELHYIKLEVEIEFLGTLEKELEERKAKLRDTVTTILMRMTVQRAKEDYIDHFMHKDIERALNEVLKTAKSESRIVQVNIPTFLIN